MFNFSIKRLLFYVALTGSVFVMFGIPNYSSNERHGVEIESRGLLLTTNIVSSTLAGQKVWLLDISVSENYLSDSYPWAVIHFGPGKSILGLPILWPGLYLLFIVLGFYFTRTKSPTYQLKERIKELEYEVAQLRAQQ